VLKSALFIEKNKEKNIILAFSGRDIGNIKKSLQKKMVWEMVIGAQFSVFNRKINLIFEMALFCIIFAVTSYF